VIQFHLGLEMRSHHPIRSTLMGILDELNRLNIEFGFSESIDTSGPLGRMVIIGAIGQLERSLIVE
jgi:hypothetical protein